MNINACIREFESLLVNSLAEGSFLKIVMSGNHAESKDLVKILVRSIEIKKGKRLSFTYRFRTRDIIKNYAYDEATALIETYLTEAQFRVYTLVTAKSELILDLGSDNRPRLKKRSISNIESNNLSHDRKKSRLIETNNKPYLEALKLIDSRGNVLKSGQDKYKQINRYIEILGGLLADIDISTIEHIVDMGCGKGYLTFALYDYIRSALNKEVAVTGVEYRSELVSFCNKVASESGFENLRFEEGSIVNYHNPVIDVLIALHACDTATDEALYKGISCEAKLIVVAPCCHKQIRREMEQSTVPNDVSFLVRHGIFLERQAEMITDGMRALVLEYFGYKTKIFEFISDVHTPKNVLIVGLKSKVLPDNERRKGILEEFKRIKTTYGIKYHELERLTAI